MNAGRIKLLADKLAMEYAQIGILPVSYISL